MSSFSLREISKYLNSQQDLIEYKRKLTKSKPDEKFTDIVEYDKEFCKVMHRKSYYDSNPKAKIHRGSKIMENIIDKDFEKKWKLLNHSK